MLTRSSPGSRVFYASKAKHAHKGVSTVSHISPLLALVYNFRAFELNGELYWVGCVTAEASSRNLVHVILMDAVHVYVTGGCSAAAARRQKPRKNI